MANPAARANFARLLQRYLGASGGLAGGGGAAQTGGDNLLTGLR
jgi:hypothetical protein